MDLGEIFCNFLLQKPQSRVLMATHFKNPSPRYIPVLGFPSSSSAKTRGVCYCAVDAKMAGGELFSVTSSSKSDVDYLGESTKGDLNVKQEHLDAFGPQRVGVHTLLCYPRRRTSLGGRAGIITKLRYPAAYNEYLTCWQCLVF